MGMAVARTLRTEEYSGAAVTEAMNESATAASEVAYTNKDCQRHTFQEEQSIGDYLGGANDLGGHDSFDIAGFDVGGILRVDDDGAERKGGRGDDCFAMHFEYQMASKVMNED